MKKKMKRELRTLLRWILTDAKNEAIKDLAKKIEDSLGEYS